MSKLYWKDESGRLNCTHGVILYGDSCADCERSAQAARDSFGEDNSLGNRSWGRGRHGSIPKTHGAEGRNDVD